MNRMEEYSDLVTQLKDVPAALETALSRAQARLNRRRAGYSLGGLASAAAFVLAVNLSPPFAYACQQVPLVRALAQAVTLSPSLQAAVDNQHVQPVNQEQTKAGITARVEYLIADRKQINIFYSLKSADSHPLVALQPDFVPLSGPETPDYSFSCISSEAPDGTIRQLTANFDHDTLPDKVSLLLKVGDNEATAWDAPLAEFIFPLTLDPALTDEVRVIALNREFTLDGQKLTAATVEIYPTQLRLNISADPNNTAWLAALDFYAEDENGRRFQKPGRRGASIADNAPRQTATSHKLESPFFAENGKLTLKITGAAWLEKSRELVMVDLAGCKMEPLQSGIRLESATRDGSGWKLVFSAPLLDAKPATYTGWSTRYQDEAGGKYHRDGHTWYAPKELQGEGAGKSADTAGRFTESFSLENYSQSTVLLAPEFTLRGRLAEAIAIEVE